MFQLLLELVDSASKIMFLIFELLLNGKFLGFVDIRLALPLGLHAHGQILANWRSGFDWRNVSEPG